MQYQTEILRFEEGARSRHPSPDATIAAAQPNVLLDAGNQIAVLVDLTPQLPYRSREIRTLVVKTYWASSGSIVARLRRALATANRHLITFNQKAPAGNKCAGSITCAVFADGELFLGQVGAAYAYIFHPPNDATLSLDEAVLELFPRRDRLLIPLGGTVPPVIHIGYTTMSPGSVACLATTRIAESQAREAWLQALSLSKLNLVSSHLNREFTGKSNSGSIVLFHAQASPILKPPPWVQSRRPTGTLNRGAQQSSPATTARPASLTPISGPSPRGQSSPRAVSSETIPVVRRSPAIQPTNEARSGRVQQGGATVTPAGLMPESTAGVRLDGKPRPRPELPQVRLSMPPFRDWIEDVGRRWKTQRRQRQLRTTERSTTAERARLHQALRTLLPGKVEGKDKAIPRVPPIEKPSILGGLALGLLLVVVLITLTKYLQLGGPLKAEELLAEAQELKTQAYSTQEPEDWYSLLDLTHRIVRLDPQNTEAQDLLEEAQQAVDTLESAAMLSVTPLLDLGTAPAPRHILVAGGWVYILETATDAVIALPLGDDHVSSLAEGPTAILRRGQNYLGEIVTHLVDFAWIEPGGSYPDGAVFVYSEGGTIFIYEPALGPGSITAQRIQGDLKPGNVTVMETFGDNVYLVHRQLNQILMYEPVNGVYDTARPYFTEGAAPDMQLTQDLAIDGRVYLLMGDGTLQTYFGGSDDHTFEVRDLPDTDFAPLVMTIESDPENGLVYLADTQRERIVALNKRGEFVHQYRLPRGELRRIEALAISETAQVLYLIAENQLFAAPLPAFGIQATQ